eukprot:4945563-Prymnesium_polylepis.2
MNVLTGGSATSIVVAMPTCRVAAGSGVATGMPAARSAVGTCSTEAARMRRTPYVMDAPAVNLYSLGSFHGVALTPSRTHSRSLYAFE